LFSSHFCDAAPLTNQISSTPPTPPWQRLAIALLTAAMVLVLVFFASHLLQWRDPYVRQVLALPGDVVKGQVIFQVNCAACHGIQGDGLVGPSLRRVAHRRSKLSLIQQVVEGKTPPMPKFQPSPEVMADLLGYLEQL
jgi:mono/diheme cytochrome c family protein